MRAKTFLLGLLLGATITAGVLAGCVTTRTSTPSNASSVPTIASEHLSTISSEDHDASTARYSVTIGKTTVYAEAAKSPAERETGLMNRTFLNENSGMLFVFSTEQKMSFWMKNMYISLDIVFITAEMRVLEVYRSVPPCTTDSCISYTPSAPIKYALEVNAGFSEQHRIAPGDVVVIAPLS